MALCCCPFNCPTVLSAAIVVAALLGLRVAPWEVFWGIVGGLAVLYALFAEKTVRTPLSGKVVLVTGASSGLGKAISLEAAKRGCKKLILVARSEEKLKETAAECMGVKVHEKFETIVETCDLMSAQDIKRLCAKVTAEHGALDLLVNNAGAGAWKHIEDTTPEEAIGMMAVPVQSMIACTSLLVPAMAKAKTGHVMNVTSAAGMVGFRGAVGYSAARWAVRGFSKNLYWDLKELGIGVTLLCPAEVEGTDYFKNAPGKAGGDSHARIPLLFQIVGWMKLNYSTTMTAWAGLNAVENGWSVANTPFYATHLFMLLNNILPFFVESLCNMGSVGKRSANKEKDQTELGTPLVEAAS